MNWMANFFRNSLLLALPDYFCHTSLVLKRILTEKPPNGGSPLGAGARHLLSSLSAAEVFVVDHCFPQSSTSLQSQLHL
jgi:hypothetical protein